MVEERTKLIDHLEEQRVIAASRIRELATQILECSECGNELFRLIDSMSGAADGCRVSSDLLARLEAEPDVARAYYGLMSFRLSDTGKFSQLYFQELGDAAYFAGLGPGVKFGKSK